MREAYSCKGTNIDLADDNGNNVETLEAEKRANGGKLIVEAVYTMSTHKSNTFCMCLSYSV